MVYAIVIVTMLVFALVDLLIRFVRSRWPKAAVSAAPHSSGNGSESLAPPDSRRPAVHIVTASSGEVATSEAFNVPAGLFIARGHTWVALLADGQRSEEHTSELQS